ncbi:MAG TPA: LLM class F420-dependent oxidoreductase [Acidimicrobiales bacterium]|nr:LLM class F420-dependent oxidoreductase [Acidimicrobiales bacterium]
MRLRIFVEPQQGATYDTLRRAAQCAEAAGFDAFFRSDHYLAMGSSDGLPGPTDAWTTLAGLARDTTTIRLGTLVTSATFRLPGPLAITVAQVDEMSGGRVELGLGAGWYDAEHAAYGIPFPPTGERFERLEEQLACVTGLWTTPLGDTFSHEGRHYHLEASPALPKPLQQPHPPIIIGGAGARRTPRLAASFAQEFNAPFFSPTDAAAQYARVDEACRAIGRDPATLRKSVAVTTCCGTSDAEVDRRAVASGWKPEDLRAHGACGSPDEVAGRLAEWSAAGATVAYLQVLDLHDLDHIELLGRELVARLAR